MDHKLVLEPSPMLSMMLAHLISITSDTMVPLDLQSVSQQAITSPYLQLYNIQSTVQLYISKVIHPVHQTLESLLSQSCVDDPVVFCRLSVQEILCELVTELKKKNCWDFGLAEI